MWSSQVLSLVQEELAQVEEEIYRQLDFENPLLAKIQTHILQGQGKRLRPILLLLCAKLCGYTGRQAIFLASIIELVHAATLLHDDVIDEALIRRGQISAYGRWGNNVPILAGDYLFSKLTKLLAQSRMPYILEIVTHTVMLITEGEIREITKRGDIHISEEEYFDIITKKTASLIAACCQIGAVLGQLGSEAEEAMKNYGLSLGIAYQLVDDILDFVGKEEVLGKPIGNDLKEGSLTIPLIHVLKHATEPEVMKLKSMLQSQNGNGIAFDYVQELVRKYGGIDYAQDKARGYIAQAQQSLEVFEDSAFRQALYAISEYVIHRNA